LMVQLSDLRLLRVCDRHPLTVGCSGSSSAVPAAVSFGREAHVLVGMPVPVWAPRW